MGGQNISKSKYIGETIKGFKVLDTKADYKGNRQRTIYILECTNCKNINHKYSLSGNIKCECRYVNSHHNMTNTRLYKVYQSMKRRIFDKRAENYKDYGGRGIKICDEWLNDFMNFYNWAIINGYDENAPKWECTLDRIDVNGNYEPSNCRWVPMSIQNYNKKNNFYIVYRNQKKTLKEWSKELGIERSVLSWRLKNDWSVEKSFTTPIRTKKKVNK